MKKFGTPTGAGPGNDNENAGFEGLAARVPARRVADGLLVLFFFARLFSFPLLFFGALLAGV